MAQRSHLSVFCFGHSFVRHFRKFNRDTPSNNGFPSINLAFSPEEFHVAYYGLSGGTVSIDKGRLLQHELGRFTTIGPDIVFLDIGSNDLCSPEVTPKRLATDIQKIADFLVIGHGVKVVVTVVLLSTPNLPLDTPLFVYGQGGDMVKLTQSMFSHKLTKVMSGLGYEAKLFSGHSLRRGGGGGGGGGGASWSFQRGLPEKIIQVMGDWKSDAYKVYLETSVHTKQQFMKMFCDGLPSI